jgi:hypothetical protein
MAALPSFHEHGDTQNGSRKAETAIVVLRLAGLIFFEPPAVTMLRRMSLSLAPLRRAGPV